MLRSKYDLQIQRYLTLLFVLILTSICGYTQSISTAEVINEINARRTVKNNPQSVNEYLPLSQLATYYTQNESIDSSLTFWSRYWGIVIIKSPNKLSAKALIDSIEVNKEHKNLILSEDEFANLNYLGFNHSEANYSLVLADSIDVNEMKILFQKRYDKQLYKEYSLLAERIKAKRNKLKKEYMSSHNSSDKCYQFISTNIVVDACIKLENHLTATEKEFYKKKKQEYKDLQLLHSYYTMLEQVKN